MVPVYKGDKAFKKIIDDIDLGKDIYSVKSFVAGYVWGMEIVQPSRLIAELLLQETDDEIELESESQAMDLYGNIMGLWNEISSHNKKIVCAFRNLPALPVDLSKLNNFLWNFEADINLFLAGLLETGSYDSGDREISGYISELEEMAHIIEKLSGRDNISSDMVNEVHELMCNLYQRWKVIFPPYVRIDVD